MPRRRRTPPEQEPQPPAELDDGAQPVRVLDANQVVAYNFRAARELRGWTQDHVAYLLVDKRWQQSRAWTEHPNQLTVVDDSPTVMIVRV